MSKPYQQRTLKWRYIYLTMFIWWVVFSLINLYAWPVIFFMVPAFSIFAGWQMGVLSERNDWMTWYKKSKVREEDKR